MSNYRPLEASDWLDLYYCTNPITGKCTKIAQEDQALEVQ